MSEASETVLDLCHDCHRRIILAVLSGEQRSLTLNDLTKTIVKHNHHLSISDISEDELSQIRLSLYHVHIPKLEEAEVLEYDPERQLVEPTEQLDELQPYLSSIIDVSPDLESPIRYDIISISRVQEADVLIG